TITHTYFAPGTYNVTLHATNGCSDTTSVETIIVYPLPVADFNSASSLICIGQSVQFTNASTGASSYLWNFGDNTTSTNTNPAHSYNVPGMYMVTLITYSFNAPGTVCTDTVTRLIQVVSSLPGDFTADALLGNCSPFTVNFANLNLPSVSAIWNFGDGQTATGDNVSHTFNAAGIYHVTLTVIVPGGCQYVTMKTITVLGPQGNWTHTTDYLCDGNASSFQVAAQNYDSVIYHFGDGTSLSTTSNFVFHTYENAGVYYPWVILKNNQGCEIVLPGNDSIKVDKISAGFTASHVNNCGNTEVTFVDTSHAFFGKSLVKWKFGDGQEGAGFNIVHTYIASGTYPVEMIVIGESGCSDTIMKPIVVHVNNLPVAQIQTASEMCTKKDFTFNSHIVSTDDISIIKWILSNGATGTGNTFNFNFQQAGDYEITLIVGTVNGCFDTVSHSFHINPTPTVVAGADLTLCLGGSAPLNVSGINVSSYQWMPLQGL
ncbi:MAG TPA: PKD domain-containing protein, partial [Chitinophagaceae bacterium]|nr:PKD domain-containing protein [Chitinophagaceae bacterium]